jgi:hypothetical protein
MPVSGARLYQPRRQQTVAGMKARQAVKIREIKEALVASGILTLDEQTKALGLNRSTAWTVLKGDHKSSGLSATIINCILAATQSPPLVRANIRSLNTSRKKPSEHTVITKCNDANLSIGS